MLWKYLARPALFSLDAERAHYAAMKSFCLAHDVPGGSGLTRSLYRCDDPRLKTQCWGIPFDNPIGLAAGFDKNAQWFNALSDLGFGFVEVGTITRWGQPGNDRPRLFRLKTDQALINRLGFNNDGCEAVAERLKNSEIRPVLGINLGKSKRTPIDEAADDYLFSLKLLHPFARYITVNVSSPNTPGLRALQDREPLQHLLRSLSDANRELAAAAEMPPLPILLKIAPDLNEDQLIDVLDIATATGISGLIATNTTISRDGLSTDAHVVEQIGAGGLSGRPLTERSREVVRFLYRESAGKMPIVGVGGIMNGDDAWEMFRAGASLIQVYTGFIYGGPAFVRNLLKRLIHRMKEEQVDSVSDIRGH